jgi:hypothetical protein
LAKPAKRVADRRLRQVQPAARARNAAFGIDGVEDGEQIEVDP